MSGIFYGVGGWKYMFQENNMQKIYFIMTILWIITIFSAADDMALWQEEQVMTDFWYDIKAHATQEKKDEMLFEIIKTLNHDKQQVAAAIYAGAHVPTLQAQLRKVHFQSLLPWEVCRGNISYVRFLLEHGANVHEKDPGLGKPIRLIKTVSMAELLIKHGALKQLKSDEMIDIFQEVMHYDASPDLIPLLKQYQFDPTATDHYGWNVLMALTMYPWQDMVHKAQLIFEGMEAAHIKKLINVKAVDGKTIFTCIDYELRCRCEENKLRLQAYRMFLLQKRDSIQEAHVPQQQEDEKECSICFDELQNRPCQKTVCCKHTFHQTCLSAWLNSSPTCPLCRANTPK